MSVLDDKGRCCGQKPMNYKRSPEAYRFCGVCYRAYDSAGEQIVNWAWRKVDGGFESTRARVYEGAA